MSSKTLCRVILLARLVLAAAITPDLMRNRRWALVALAVLSLAAGCRQGPHSIVAATRTPQPAGTLQLAPPDLSTVGTESVCPLATGVGTILPAVSIDSITFVINGLEQVLRSGDTLQARPGDEVLVGRVTLCAAPFSGDGGEACVDIAPVDQSGQEMASEHQGSHLVRLTPGLLSIAWVSETWTVGEDWRQFSAVVNHWPPIGTKDLGCASGLCERDDRILIELQK